MSYRVPIGGVVASVYYDFEDAFRVYSNPYTDPNYHLKITKSLGQGIKITRWDLQNSVKVVTGINSIEAVTSTDGPVQGTVQFELEATGNLDFIEAAMGTHSTEQAGLVDKYTAGAVPRSMIVVIYIPNDSDDTTHATGDCYVLKGVIPTDISFSIENGDTPLHITIDCIYATEVPFGVTNIPETAISSEEVYNFGQAMAYFYNPGNDGTGPASFNSFETIIEKMDFSMTHGAEMLPGISTRLAQERWYKNLLYDMSLIAIYREKERFTEKFYGCKEGPVSSDSVKPFRKILIVLQNSKFCSQDFRRLEFEFNIAKLDSLERSVTADEAIKERLRIKPLNLVIRSWAGHSPSAEFSVSPNHIIQGDLVTYKGSFFTPGMDLNVLVDGTLRTTIPVNCSGAAEWREIATAVPWTIGSHVITAVSTGTPSNTVTTYAYATATAGEAIPKVTVCPTYIKYVEGQSYPLIITGYGFQAGTITRDIFSSAGRIFNEGLVSSTGYIREDGVFYIAERGKSTVKLTQTVTGGTKEAQADFYITDITQANTTTFTAIGMKPQEKCLVYVGTTYKGATLAGWDSTATFTIAGFTSGTVTFKQILVSGDIIAENAF